MKMYKEYLEELHEGKSLIKSDWGFASYWIRQTEHGKECYIEDIYIKKEKRKLKEASELANLITKKAIEENCNFLTGSVVPSANNSTISLKVLLGYGFKLWCSDNNIIWFRKNL